MKMILIAILASFTIACEAQTSQAKTGEVILDTVNVSAKVEESAKSEMKKMCITVYDAKKKKDVEKCRTIKTHKKFEGTAVPEKKKK